MPSTEAQPDCREVEKHILVITMCWPPMALLTYYLSLSNNSPRHTVLLSPFTVYRENKAQGGSVTHPSVKPGFEPKELAPEFIFFTTMLHWLSLRTD